MVAAFSIAASTQALADSQIIHDSTHSDSLGRSIPMYVYLPDGYQTAKEPYPVIYMLHGAESKEDSWVDRGGIKVTADNLIARKQLRPSVIVMPTTGPQTWYVDGNADKAETAILKDLLPFVEKKYNTRKDRAGRSVAGLSMGGYGALNLSLSYPELFCAAGIFSPAIYVPLPPQTSAARRAAQFVDKSGAFDESAWTKALYTSRIDDYKKKGTVVPMWIQSGDHDPLGIVVSAANLYWELNKTQKNAVEYRVVDGGHDWLVFRDSSVSGLPWMNSQCEVLDKGK